MTIEELYEKEFGDAESIPKESIIRLLKNQALSLGGVSKLFAVGKTVKIIRNTSGHCFELGDVVTIEGYEPESGAWKCYNSKKEAWWIYEEDANVC